jgi:hypothetical protein
MSLTASTDKTFLDTIERWLSSEREILVLFRYPYAAGNRSFEFFSSPAALFERLHQLQRRTSVTVFRRAQLPLRNDEFIESCMRVIPEGSEFLVWRRYSGPLVECLDSTTWPARRTLSYVMRLRLQGALPSQ